MKCKKKKEFYGIAHHGACELCDGNCVSPPEEPVHNLVTLAELQEENARLVTGIKAMSATNGGNPTCDYTKGWADGIKLMANMASDLLENVK